MKEDIKEELKKMLEEIENNPDKKAKYSTDGLTKIAASNLVTTVKVLCSINKGKSIVEAANEHVRSYEEALEKCLEIGAKDVEEFKYDFTTYYLNTILSLVAYLVAIKDFAKDDKNRAFLKSKIRECLIYIDML